MVLLMDSYEILKKIGDGTFGTVYLCRKKPKDQPCSQIKGFIDDDTYERQSHSLVAIKKMKKRYYNWDDCMRLREVKALRKLSHDNIIKLIEVIREDNHLYLVFEHMEENLHQLIRRQSSSFSETTIRNIVHQIVAGLAYIHRNGFFHRDIKPENLLCADGSGSIKIADFGLIREIESRPPYTDYVSTRWYRAPELLLHSTAYSWAVDIWSVGCITGELYIQRPLFPGRSEIDQIFKICQTLGTPDVSAWPEGERLASLVQVKFPNIVPLELRRMILGCSTEGLEFIQSMLKWVSKERLTAAELLSHRYLSTLNGASRFLIS